MKVSRVNLRDLKLRKLVRWLIHTAGVILALLAVVIALASTAWFRNVLQHRIEAGLTQVTGGKVEIAGMDFSFNSRRVNAIRRSSSAYLPGLDDAKVIEIWRGLRPCTPDGLPIISRSNDFNNLIIAAGHAMLGMSLGPITGKLVTQLVGGEKMDMDISSLGMGRFG